MQHEERWEERAEVFLQRIAYVLQGIGMCAAALIVLLMVAL